MATKSQASAAPTEADTPDAAAGTATEAEAPTGQQAAAVASAPLKAPTAPTVPPVPGRKPGGVFEYVDATPSTTLFDGHPPQSAEYGDVCLLPYDPENPNWQPSPRAVNRKPAPRSTRRCSRTSWPRPRPTSTTP